MTFVATAYRWADRNGHHYVVYAGPDEATARRMAEAEVDYRGGKYATEVVRYGAVTGEHDQQCEVVAAFGDPVTYNWHADALSNIGGAIWSAAEGWGHVWALPDAAAELTPWARGIVWKYATQEATYRVASERAAARKAP